MKLALSPELKVKLRARRRSVELSGAELAALREYLPDSAPASGPCLPVPKFRELFEEGFLLPEHSFSEKSAAAWEKKLRGAGLTADVAFDLRLAEWDSGIELPISLYLPPEVTELVARLYRQVQEFLIPIYEAAAAQGRRFPTRRATKLLHGWLAGWLDHQAGYRKWFRWKLRSDGFLDFAWRRQCEAAPESHSLRLAVLKRERFHELFLPLRSIRKLGALLDYLNGHRPDLPLDSLQDSGVRKILTRLESLGGFAACDLRSPKPSESLKLTHMGHAHLIVDSPAGRVLVDPWLFPDSPDFETRPLPPSRLGPLKAIFFTHHHGDHMDPHTLLSLPKNVPVYVPRFRPGFLKPNHADYLRRLGFEDVRELVEGDRCELGEGFEVRALPFFGEGSDKVRFDGLSFLVRYEKQNALLLADSSPDSRGRSILNYLRRLVDELGPMDVVFGTWWQQRAFTYRLSPLALVTPGIDPKRWLETTESCDCPPSYLAAVTRAARTKLLVTYAESGPECFLAKEKMSPYVRVVSFFWKSLESTKAALKQKGTRLIEASPHLEVVLRPKRKIRLNLEQVGRSRLRL